MEENVKQIAIALSNKYLLSILCYLNKENKSKVTIIIEKCLCDLRSTFDV